jgi:hypothetical protein
MANDEISARAREERYHVIRAEILARLRPVCSDMPDDVFLEMVDNMAAIRLKYELKDFHRVR